LVLAWIAQNVLLVFSSVMRLKVYVEAYSLTELRLASFFWMALVAIGLMLIVVQILRKKPNGWLVEANARALAVALFAAALTGFPETIAEYNVANSRETRGIGPALDVSYLLSMGPRVIPILDVVNQKKRDQCWAGLDTWRKVTAKQVSKTDWRGMDYRTWRLERYLVVYDGCDPSPKTR
jgi:hypothetical protein